MRISLIPRPLLALSLAVLALFSLSSVALAHQGVKHYQASLAPLNNSGVTGTATLTLDGDQLTVAIQASGLEANALHPQHIHGFMENKRNSTCPTQADDMNGDGIVDLGEGLPDYGPVLLPLTPFPTAPDGTIAFEQTYTVDPKELGPLQNRAIVLHGLTVDGEYIATLPVACGQIKVTPGGKSR